MDFTKKQPAIIYLDKTGFYFYSVALPNIVSLGFQETSVKDMDVVNGAAIADQIKTFIAQYQIAPSNITIFLSPNVTFEKDITGLADDEQAEEVKKFTDTIPFESVLSKEFPIEKGVKVIGCNEDLYMEIKMGFEKNAFSVDGAIPYQLLGVDQALIQNFTVDNAALLLKKVDRLRQFTLTKTEKEKAATTSVTPTQTTNSESGKPQNNKIRLYAMVGVFAVLFIVLGYMLLHMKP